MSYLVNAHTNLIMLCCFVIADNDGYERSEFVCSAPAITCHDEFTLSHIISATSTQKSQLAAVTSTSGYLLNNLVNFNTDNNGGSCGQSVDDRNVRED